MLDRHPSFARKECCRDIREQMRLRPMRRLAIQYAEASVPRYLALAPVLSTLQFLKQCSEEMCCTQARLAVSSSQSAARLQLCVAGMSLAVGGRTDVSKLVKPLLCAITIVSLYSLVIQSYRYVVRRHRASRQNRYCPKATHCRLLLTSGARKLG